MDSGIWVSSLFIVQHRFGKTHKIWGFLHKTPLLPFIFLKLIWAFNKCIPWHESIIHWGQLVFHCMRKRKNGNREMKNCLSNFISSSFVSWESIVITGKVHIHIICTRCLICYLLTSDIWSKTSWITNTCISVH